MLRIKIGETINKTCANQIHSDFRYAVLFRFCFNSLLYRAEKIHLCNFAVDFPLSTCFPNSLPAEPVLHIVLGFNHETALSVKILSADVVLVPKLPVLHEKT